MYRAHILQDTGRPVAGRIVLAEDLDALAHRGFLTPIEFTQIKNVALHDVITTHAAIFHHTPVEVLFAIFAPCRTTKEHDDR